MPDKLMRRAAALLLLHGSLLACHSASPESTTPSSASAPTTAAGKTASPQASGTGGARPESPPPANTQTVPVAGTRSEPARAGTTSKEPPADASAGVDMDAGAGESSTPTRESVCSGCAAEMLNKQDMKVHLHHVHLNVADRERSAQFYEKFFEAKRIQLNGVSEALRVTPTLILLEQRTSQPRNSLPTAIQHMGWGSADVGGWYERAYAAGIAPDTRGNTLFNTNDKPTIGGPGSGATIALLPDIPACFPVPDEASYMYVLGPDQERIEVWTGADRRVNHLHFTTADLAATASFYQRLLGLPNMAPLFTFSFFLDDILFFFEAIGTKTDYVVTDDHTLGHFAFSVTDLEAWRKRVTEQAIEVVSEPALAHGFMSFFVRGPDGALIELVQAAPAPELCPLR